MIIEEIKTNNGEVLLDLFLIKPTIYSDERGFFMESWNQSEFNYSIGKEIKFVQDNHSLSKEGVIRGLHYQLAPQKQAKLVRCISGQIFDVVVDIRKESKSFGKWAGIYIDDKKNYQIWIPEGFAHGFLSLKKCTQVLYKTTNYWSEKLERSINWNDKDLSINWPYKSKINLISKKDSEAPFFNQIKAEELL